MKYIDLDCLHQNRICSCIYTLFVNYCQLFVPNLLVSYKISPGLMKLEESCDPSEVERHKLELFGLRIAKYREVKTLGCTRLKDTQRHVSHRPALSDVKQSEQLTTDSASGGITQTRSKGEVTDTQIIINPNGIQKFAIFVN